MTGKRKGGGTARKQPPASPWVAWLPWVDRSTSRKPKIKRTWKQHLLRIAGWSAITALVLTLIGVASFVYLYKTIDVPEPNAEFLTETSYVYYADGDEEVGRYATQLRDSIPLAEMSTDLKDAVVAAEDRTFYTNKGIDPKGILRAAFSNASGNAKQGGSTITQQYVKILYLTQERSYQRKIKEAILSLKVQRQQSKDEVLEGYLNTIYFGRGAYGVEAASNVYFTKSAKDLSLRQAAALAAILNDPNDLDPADGKEAKAALKSRYTYVVDSMESVGNITAEQATKANERLPKFKNFEAETTYGGQKGHALKMVKDELLRLRKIDGSEFTEEEIDGGGLRITTTLTRKAMTAAEEGVREARPDGFSDRKLHIGVASVEPGTGAIRGFYAGQDYLRSQINWAVAGGQAGSTFKPFALAAGIKDGYSLNDTFDGNSPYETPDGLEFENQGDTDYGSSVTLTKATEDSINTAYIDLTLSMDDGPKKIIKMANDLGIPPAKAKTNEEWGFPDQSLGLEPITGVALGSQTVSPINMAAAYASLANEGVAARPFLIERVEDAQGELLYDHKVKDDRVISEDVAADVTYAMQQVVTSGSGTAALDLDRPVAGKTGTATTSSGAVSSAWFTGFTPQLATSVMYVRGKGNEELKDWLPSYFGGAFPAETWTAVMARDMEGLEPLDFPEPAFVDGEAPQDGHEYVPPPPPPPPKPRPPKPSETTTDGPTDQPTEGPTEQPTEEPTEPTEEPTEPPTTEPPPTEEPSEDPSAGCGLLGCPDGRASGGSTEAAMAGGQAAGRRSATATWWGW
ncbi:MAG: transglycosylase domain-containing protein [Nocardioides sp.]